jgi:glycopeptide antibiotics resistance protein
MRRPSTTQRWSLIGLSIYVIAVLGMLLLPVSYGGVVAAAWRWLTADAGARFGAGWIEFTANIILFVPMGFLLTLVFRHPWYGASLAVVLSVVAELAQIVIPNRQATLRDVISNGIGAAVGALLAWLFVLRRRRSNHRPGR